MMRILITGGAGYIGSLLTPALLAAGHRVTVLDNFLFRQATLADCCAYDTFEVVRGDCRDTELVQRFLPHVDVIIPLAALVGAPPLRSRPRRRRHRQSRCGAGDLPAGQSSATDYFSDHQ